jgi:hypothetical protein
VGGFLSNLIHADEPEFPDYSSGCKPGDVIQLEVSATVSLSHLFASNLSRAGPSAIRSTFDAHLTLAVPWCGVARTR